MYETWYYPKELGIDNVINVWFQDDEIKIDVYELPKNWKELVTNDGGQDGKKSIHDLMSEVFVPNRVCERCGYTNEDFDEVTYHHSGLLLCDTCMCAVEDEMYGEQLES